MPSVTVYVAFLPPKKTLLLSQVAFFSSAIGDNLLPSQAIDDADEDGNLYLWLELFKGFPFVIGKKLYEAFIDFVLLDEFV